MAPSTAQVYSAAVAAFRTVAPKCPTCGASLVIPPGVPQVVCRYCQNTIQLEYRKPPPEVRPFGAPGAIPSRTLFIDPDAATKAGRAVGLVITLVTLLPILIALVAGVGPLAFRSCMRHLKPFPVACGNNDEL